MRRIDLFKPWYNVLETYNVGKVLESGWSGLGPQTEKFERMFARHLGVKHAVLLNSCTAALFLALKLRGIGPGHRVAVPTMTFASTAHVVRHCGAEVVLQDVDERTLLMCWNTEDEHKYDAWIPVLYAGQPCKPPEHFGNGNVIYDCAHAVGSTFDARGKLCCWSFHAVKNLAMGEGGALTTDDDELADRARRLRWMGITKDTWRRTKDVTEVRHSCGGVAPDLVEERRYNWEYDVAEVGWKLHGNDLAAAVGLAQLEKLPVMQQRRQQLWDRYRQELGTMEWLPGHSALLAVLRHPNRDGLMDHLAHQGIGSGCHYKPLHLMSCYADQADRCPVANRVWQELVTLPLHPQLTDHEQGQVIKAVKEFK